MYIQGINSAVIRDVTIFLDPMKKIPDETTDTLWKLTAKVYFDKIAGQNGNLRISRVDGKGPTIKEWIHFTTNDDEISITTTVPVS